MYERLQGAVVVAQLVERSQLESSHRQTLYYLYTVNCFENTKIKKKRHGMAHLKKTLESHYVI